MNILFLNTYSQTGGAAIACQRILKVLQNIPEVSTQMLVHEGKNDAQVLSLEEGFWKKKKVFARFAAERLAFLPYEAEKKYRFAFSPTRVGVDISKHPAVLEADILHLHWINFGFLSLKNLKQLFALQKPIVWTLHDMWAFTGGCHYSEDCTFYEQECGHCFYLKNSKKDDLSHQIWEKKEVIYSNRNLHFTAPSRWTKKVAQASKLLKSFPIHHITHPLDVEIFKPLTKENLYTKYRLDSDKKYILFGAMNINHERKGFRYLKNALEILSQKFPEKISNWELLVFGKADQEMLQGLPFQAHYLGTISSSEVLSEIYNISSLFVMPTLQEVLGFTVLEALACGTPVVGFDTGGIPDMVKHQKNGYLAEYKSATDLAKGIAWVLNHPSYQELSAHARKIVLQNHSEEKIAQEYLYLYKSLI